jgi:hypothetical protein
MLCVLRGLVKIQLHIGLVAFLCCPCLNVIKFLSHCKKSYGSTVGIAPVIGWTTEGSELKS